MAKPLLIERRALLGAAMAAGAASLGGSWLFSDARAQATEAAKPLLLTNCVVFDGNSPVLKDKMSILIEDGVIRAIGQAVSVPAGIEQMNMGGRFVMPGLIDAHFHSYWYEFAALRGKSEITPALRPLQAKTNLEAALRRGFTTVRDAGGGDINMAIALRSGLIDGPRFFYAGRPLTQRGGHGDRRPAGETEPPRCSADSEYRCLLGEAEVVDGPDQMRRVVRDHLREGATQIKLFGSGNPSLDPRDPRWYSNFTEEEIRAAVEETGRRRAYVMAHSHWNEATLRLLRNGVRSIEHGSFMQEDSIKLLVERKAFVVPTIATLAILREIGSKVGALSEWIEAGTGVGKEMLVTLDKLRRANAQVGFGSDMAAETQAEYHRREFVLRAEVFKPVEILRQATSVNAKLIQMEGKLGTVAQGAFADFVVLNGNPLEDINVMNKNESYAMVMRGGKVVTSTI